MVLVLYTLSDNASYLYQVLSKYLKGFPSNLADRISVLKLTRECSSVKRVCGVTVLVLCTSPDHVLNLY